LAPLDVTGAEDNIGPSPVVTPRTQAVEAFLPRYDNVYVRRRSVDQQRARPERRYPEQDRRAPDMFTFD